MLAQTLKAYPYQEYADDDDIQAFFAAYNNGTQTIVDWYNQTGQILTYYPTLSGKLLEWIAAGYYGVIKTQLATQASPADGMLNTDELNTVPLNTYTPSTQTFYDLDDDVFKRIITWNFFKGDGRTFNVRWLKRRVVRFLTGSNGLASQPTDAGFTIGAETTSAVGVTVASGVLSVTIDQSLLSLQTQLAPGILTLFKLAFEGGYLELPLQYSYAVSIVVNFVALAKPNVLTSATAQVAQTTAPTTVSVLGGTGNYTYAWTWLSGGTSITIDDSSAVATTFTATGMAFGETRSGIAKCTVTDTVSSLTAVATCEVTITRPISGALITEGEGLQLLTEGGTPLLI